MSTDIETMLRSYGALPATDEMTDTDRSLIEEVEGLAKDQDALIEQAYDLLSSARYDGTDPGLSRSWGQRKRRFKDAVIERRGQS